MEIKKEESILPIDQIPVILKKKDSTLPTAKFIENIEEFTTTYGIDPTLKALKVAENKFTFTQQ